jgi:acetyl-CoA acyltransferase
MSAVAEDKQIIKGGSFLIEDRSAKLTATILRELERRNGRYGMVTMCVGGGMGAAEIFERIG